MEYRQLFVVFLFSISNAKDCGDFTIGSCQNSDLIWDNEVKISIDFVSILNVCFCFDQVADAKFCQQFCHLQQDCVFFDYYEGRCKLYRYDLELN